MIEGNIKEPKIRVLGARVVVLEEKQEKTTASGIVIPGREKEPTYRGIIVAVGDGAMLDDGTRVPMRVAIGDKIIYNTWTGSPISVDDEVYCILNERDIIAVLE